MDIKIFDKAIELLCVYEQETALDTSQRQNLAEAKNRLKNAKSSYSQLTSKNATLLAQSQPLKHMKEQLSTESIEKVLRDQAKNDVQLAAFFAQYNGISEVARTELDSFDMGRLNNIPNSLTMELENLHSETEQYYHNLWAVIQRLRQLPAFKKFKPAKVRDVRNHLIEHVDNHASSGATIYSFGIATGGPVLRPMKPSGAKASHDGGLNANTEEFLQVIIFTLSNK